MVKVSPFFTFGGQCASAMELYEKAFGAVVTYKARFSEASSKDFQYKDESKKDYIYHAQMKIGEQIIMLCDDSDGTLGTGTDVRSSELSLCVVFDTADEVKAAYEVMKDGAKIIVPMASATYSNSYVFLTDKFGISWWIMSE